MRSTIAAIIALAACATAPEPAPTPTYCGCEVICMGADGLYRIGVAASAPAELCADPPQGCFTRAMRSGGVCGE